MPQNEKEKKKLKQLIRKNKYLAYILLGILGGVLIAYARVATPNWKDIPMGIGTGIVATVIGFIILLILLPDENENDEKLKELLGDEDISVLLTADNDFIFTELTLCILNSIINSLTAEL